MEGGEVGRPLWRGSVVSTSVLPGPHLSYLSLESMVERRRVMCMNIAPGNIAPAKLQYGKYLLASVLLVSTKSTNNFKLEYENIVETYFYDFFAL